jgi:adenosine kinase
MISDDEGDDLSFAGASIYSNPHIQTFQSSQKLRFRSLIAIGNPIVDITAQTDEETLKKFNLKLGGTVFANEENKGYFKLLEKDPKVKYIPGGSIQNTLRVASWCINMEPQTSKLFKITMLGATGKDNYREKIINAFTLSGVNYLLECIPEEETSRCGVGIIKKERCLLPEIRASNKISEKFIKEHRDEIYKYDALLIEGYFIKERFEIIKSLCLRFKIKKKIVILTLGSVDTVEKNYDKVIELVNCSDLVVGNMEELETLLGEKGLKDEDIFEKLSKKLVSKSRLFVVTNGKKGVILAKYNYKKGNMDFVLHSFPSQVKNEEIVDLNGAGDAFLGGFLSQYMQGKSFEACCKAGNDVAGVIIRNIGCTFQKHIKIKFSD